MPDSFIGYIGKDGAKELGEMILDKFPELRDEHNKDVPIAKKPEDLTLARNIAKLVGKDLHLDGSIGKMFNPGQTGNNRITEIFAKHLTKKGLENIKNVIKEAVDKPKNPNGTEKMKVENPTWTDKVGTKQDENKELNSNNR